MELFSALESGEVQVKNERSQKIYRLLLTISEREKMLLQQGGLLASIRNKQQ